MTTPSAHALLQPGEGEPTPQVARAAPFPWRTMLPSNGWQSEQSYRPVFRPPGEDLESNEQAERVRSAKIDLPKMQVAGEEDAPSIAVRASWAESWDRRHRSASRTRHSQCWKTGCKSLQNL